jgi:hypothetical protein
MGDAIRGRRMGLALIGRVAIRRYLVSFTLPLKRTPGADAGGTVDVLAGRPAIAGGNNDEPQ